MKATRTTLLLTLLLPLLASAQEEPRALKPSDIDPYTVYVFQWCKSSHVTTVGNRCAAVAYFIIQDTGEWVRFPIACEDCERWTRGLCLNLEMPTNTDPLP